jgi:hypothetical protein
MFTMANIDVCLGLATGRRMVFLFGPISIVRARLLRLSITVRARRNEQHGMVAQA